jgi:hypothetical protein
MILNYCTIVQTMLQGIQKSLQLCNMDMTKISTTKISTEYYNRGAP